MKQEDISSEKILRAAKVYLAYQYPELVNKLLELSIKNNRGTSVQSKLSELLEDYKSTSVSATPSIPGKGVLARLTAKLAALLHTQWSTDKNEDRELGNI